MADDPRTRLDKLRRLKELRSKAPQVNLTREVSLAPNSARREPETVVDQLVGATEAVGALATGAVGGIISAPIAGGVAAADIALRNAAGFDEPSPSREIVENYTVPGYQPTTQAGIRMLNFASAPFQALDRGATAVGNLVQDAAIHGNEYTRVEGEPDVLGPVGIAALPTAIKMIPDFIATRAGVKGMPRTPLQRLSDVRRVEGQARNFGVDLEAPNEAQIGQLQGAADRMEPSSVPSEGMDTITDAVRRERANESTRIGNIFTEAEQGGAQVPSRTAGTLQDRLQTATGRFITGDMKSVQSLLEESAGFGEGAKRSISEVMGIRNSATVPVNDIFNFRAKINSNLPSDIHSPEYNALSNMRREVDGFLNETLTNDLVSGNPAAVQKWQEAIGEWSDFKTVFDENKIIRKLQDENATAEQVKNLVFGLNIVRAPRQAGMVIKGLKGILGEDSPEFQTLKSSALSDLLLPMIDAEPDFAKFVKNYDAFQRNNPTLANELFDEATRTELQGLRDFAGAIDKTTPIDARLKNAGFGRTAAVITAGHRLAQGALRVSLLTRAFNAIKPGAGVDRKNKMLTEILGYNPRASLFTTKPIQNVATLEEMGEGANDEEPRTISDLLSSFRGQ